MFLARYRIFASYYFLIFSALGIFTTLFPIHLADIGLSKATIGLVIATGLLASVIGPPVWGIVSDTLQARKKVLMFCQGSAAIIGLILSAVYRTAEILPLYFAYYFLQNAVVPLSDSLVLGNIKNEQYGKVRLWGSVGFAAGALLCGLLLIRLASNLVFAAYVSAAMVTVVFTYVLLPSSERVGENGLDFSKISAIFRNRRFLVLGIILMLVLIPYGAYVSFIGLYLKELGASTGVIGLAWTVAALAEVPVFYYGGQLMLKRNPWYLLGFSALVFALRWFVYGLVYSPGLIVLLQLSQSISFGVFFLIALQMINYLFPANLKATGQTLFAGLGFGLSYAIGNAAGGYIAENVSLHFLFTLSGVLAILGAGVALWAGKRWGKKL
ncbi:MAG TPA: MFS transporter [Verrucomicrobiae bacterium]|nr:MFS transporter [Verrucomicrobiae bacterium]